MFITAELTNNGKAVYVKPNDLSQYASFDWVDAYLPLADIGRIERQSNDQGVIVYLRSGASYLFTLGMVSRINGKLTNTNNPGGEIDTEEKLIEELAIMLGYKTA